MKSPLGFEEINFRSESISWDMTHVLHIRRTIYQIKADVIFSIQYSRDYVFLIKPGNLKSYPC